MKTQVSVIAILTLATLVSSQTREDIPSCARPCLDDAIKSTTSCAIDDFACVCKNFGSIQGAAVGCVLAKCGQDTALNKVLPATKKLCEGVKNKRIGKRQVIRLCPMESHDVDQCCTALVNASPSSPTREVIHIAGRRLCERAVEESIDNVGKAGPSARTMVRDSRQVRAALETIMKTKDEEEEVLRLRPPMLIMIVRNGKPAAELRGRKALPPRPDDSRDAGRIAFSV
ncbi:hypothetical protein PCL_02790 [Purpureocillium lilacinum]|uniref:CFEM domain-containing protein n=1 Tax=Purpureocillium lilacinum TaxID=33203 RepID=A0A2U3DNW7_PURLI|nr:hypothetical protein PCL_02790 [Purpureocillium lilacinum]